MHEIIIKIGGLKYYNLYFEVYYFFQNLFSIIKETKDSFNGTRDRGDRINILNETMMW